MSWLNKAHQYDIKIGRFVGGVSFTLYQMAFGLSLRYWSCIGALAIRVYVLFFKLWGSVSFNSKEEEK